MELGKLHGMEYVKHLRLAFKALIIVKTLAITTGVRDAEIFRHR